MNMKNNQINSEIAECNNLPLTTGSILRVEHPKGVPLKVLPYKLQSISDRLTRYGVCFHHYLLPAWESPETRGHHNVIHVIGRNSIQHLERKLDGRKQYAHCAIENNIVIVPKQ
jgi:hypothetical protein